MAHLASPFPLCSLVRHSAHLREMDLGNNVLGETAAADILDALRVRKKGEVPPPPSQPRTNHKGLSGFVCWWVIRAVVAG